MSDDKAYLGCTRVSDGPAEIEGSLVEFCSGCKCEVFVSPASEKSFRAQAKARNLEARYICMNCMMGHVSEFIENSSSGDEIHIMPPSEEQLKELKERMEN